MHFVDKYQPMMMKHWKKCSDSISFEEMVSEIYIGLRKNPIGDDMSHEQITKYMHTMCTRITSGAWVYGSNMGAVLGAELSKCRGSRAKVFENKKDRLSREAKTQSFIVSESRHLFSSGEEISEDDRSTLIDIEESLSGIEKSIADLIVEGHSVGQVAKKLGIHRWTLKKQYLPRIAKRLGLVDPSK